MSKTFNMTLDEDTVWKLKEMKLKAQAKSWPEFFSYITELYEKGKLEILPIERKE